jgi:RimJ/RimL family protein N-acetyltransferase
MEINLRSFNELDQEQLTLLANNSDIAKHMMNVFPHPYTLEDAKKFITMAMSHSPRRISAIEVDGILAGAIGIHPKEDVDCKNAELGYWLGEPFWNKGITSEAIALAIRYAFSTFEINRIYARTFGNNKASQKVLVKNGFVLEAKFEKTIFKLGAYEDDLIYAIRKAN